MIAESVMMVVDKGRGGKAVLHSCYVTIFVIHDLLTT